MKSWNIEKIAPPSYFIHTPYTRSVRQPDTDDYNPLSSIIRGRDVTGSGEVLGTGEVI